MKARSGTTRTKRAGRPAPPADQRGFLLVMVMVVMLVLSTVVASTLINSFLERSLAKNQNYSSVALQAAEGGLAAGMTWVRENQAALPNPYTANPNWTQTLTRAIVSGGTYNVTMRFKREWRDTNGDGDCVDPGESSGYQDTDGSPAANCPGDVVLYNKCSGADNCFNFPDALYLNAGEGYPLIEIDSTAYYGSDPDKASSYRQVVLDIARNKVALNGVKGAVSSAGATELGPSAAIQIDGSSHDINGNPGGICVENMPDAVVPDAVKLADSTCDKSCPTTGVVVNTGSPMCTTVECVLGYVDDIPLGQTAAQKLDAAVGAGHIFGTAAAAHAQLTDGNPGEITVINGDYNENTGSGHAGILIVRGTYETQGNHQFKGLVVARQVNIHGTSSVIGAVVATDGSVKAAVGNGTPAVLYSCDAINAATSGFGYGTKIAWHRLR